MSYNLGDVKATLKTLEANLSLPDSVYNRLDAMVILDQLASILWVNIIFENTTLYMFREVYLMKLSCIDINSNIFKNN